VLMVVSAVFSTVLENNKQVRQNKYQGIDQREPQAIHLPGDKTSRASCPDGLCRFA
jgi:hypothetical protein